MSLSNSILKQDQELVILPTSGALHLVRPNDTLSEIAMSYRTSVGKIKKWNGLRSDRIYTGQKLKIWTKA